MKVHRLVLALGLAAACTGCASGLNSQQKAELRHYEANGLAAQEKSPGTGAALGLLPGGGSFYGREYGLGVVNLLFWPLSILWDPVSGHDAAESINYTATKEHVNRLQRKDVDAIDERLQSGQIDVAQYALEKRKVNKKYDFN